MTNQNIVSISGKAPAPLANGSPPAWRNTQPSDPGLAVALLSACLALVRPVGMSDDQAEEWLVVAAREVSDLPPDILDQATADARRTCTHHAQIVPAVIAFGEPLLAERRRHKEFVGGFEQQFALPAPRVGEWRPTQAELDAIKASVAARFPSQRGD